MRRADIRVIAVSSFTAGFMHHVSPATILPPGLSGSWFQTLVSASARTQPWNQGAELVTAFRLADWRSKGLPELLAAVAALGRDDVRVTVCGSGEPSADLRRLVTQYCWCRLRPGLSDRELADQLAGADLFVLATRTRFGRRPSGEGFGLVLLEAQVAGTPVVAPAYGGSHDTFVDGVTGVAPVDESAEALTGVLEELLRDREHVAQMGKRAAEWARESFDPDCYASRVVAKLL
jgi:glycosyltransferase involved in cell wall biosynthesis